MVGLILGGGYMKLNKNDEVIDCLDCLYFDVVYEKCEVFDKKIERYHKDIIEYKPCKLCDGEVYLDVDEVRFID